MAVINNTNQIKYGGKAYLDPKLDPVRTVADLPTEVTEVFNGMTVTVLDDGNGKPVDYWRINGQWVIKSTGGGESYTAGQYIDISNNVISVTGVSPDSYAVKADVATAITAAQTAAVADATAWTEAQGYLKEVPANLATKEEVASAKTEVEEWVNEQGFLTEHQDISGKADISAVTADIAAVMEAETARTESTYLKQASLDEYAKSADVATAITEARDEAVVAATAWTEAQGFLKEVPSTYAEKTYVDEAVAEKQDAFTAGTALAIDENNNLNVLVDGVTIKVNGSNKLYADVSGSGGTYTAGEYISIEGNEISVTGITPDDYATIEQLSAETQARIESEFDINAKFAEYAKTDEVSSAITEAQSETFIAATAWTESQGYLKEVPGGYATKEEVSSAKTEAIAESTAWTESQGYLTEVPAEYAKVEDVATAITEAQAEAVSAATAWTEAQGYLTEVPEEYAKTEDVATAITEAQAEAVDAATAWTEEQGYLKEVPSQYVTVSELNNEISDAKDEMFSETTVWVEAQDYLKDVPGGYATMDDVASAETAAVAEATAWTEAQGYLTEVPAEYAKTDEVSSAITEAQSETFVAATAWTEEQGYLKEIPSNLATKAEVASAATEAVAEANAYTDAAVSAITVPEYSLSSVTPTPGFASTYGLMKDGSAVTGSALINIPDTAGATIRSAITADIAVGYVSAGTSFAAGTTIESILRAIFINDSPVAVGYAYYGSLATPLDETTGITAENIKAYLSRSESAASTTPWRFRVNEDDYQVIVAAPLTLELDDANDVTNGIPYYYEISNNGAPKKTLTIDGIQYGVYYCTFSVAMSRFMMEITLINA